MAVKRKQRLYQRIAGKLEEELSELPTPFPLVANLAHRYDVGVSTMRNAIRLVAAKGLLICRHGRKIERPDGQREPAGPAYLPESGKTLLKIMQERIHSGVYRTGQSLPKLGFFVLTEGVSWHTVSSVIRALQHEKLIHKHGKRWIVGPATGKFGDISVQNAMKHVVLLLMGDYSDWQAQWLRSRTLAYSFCINYQTEIERYGYRIQPAYRSELETVKGAPKGIREVQQYISSRGSCYHGTLLYTSTRAESNWRPWLSMLYEFKMPVIRLEWNYNRVASAFAH